MLLCSAALICALILKCLIFLKKKNVALLCCSALCSDFQMSYFSLHKFRDKFYREKANFDLLRKRSDYIMNECVEMCIAWD